MADEAMDEVMAELPEEGGRSGKRLILYIAVPVILLAAIGAGLYFTGIASVLLSKHQEAPGKPVVPVKERKCLDLPDMLVNLNTGGKRTNFLKIAVCLEIDADDENKVKNVQPRIVDMFQVYLRELRLEDLKGSAGVYRLREELTMRVNAALAPAKIHDVLFKEMLVQ